MVMEFHSIDDIRTLFVLATLTGKTIKLNGIRSGSTHPGTSDDEICFMRIIEKITNGSVIEISYTGTSVFYKPGILIGGKFSQNCPVSRGLGYYLECLCVLGPFCKNPLEARLKGITSGGKDVCVDTIRTVLFPLMEKFGIMEPELVIESRGSAPLGGGEIVLKIPHVIGQTKTLFIPFNNNVDINNHVSMNVNIGSNGAFKGICPIQRIRGIAYSTRVSPSIVNSIVEGCREVLANTGCETHIYTDPARGEEAGKSPGYGVTIVAEMGNGWNINAESVGSPGSDAYQVGKIAAQRLLYEISLGGLISRSILWECIIFMVLGSEDISQIYLGLGCIGPNAILLLRLVKRFFGVESILDVPEDENEEGETKHDYRSLNESQASIDGRKRHRLINIEDAGAAYQIQRILKRKKLHSTAMLFLRGCGYASVSRRVA